MANNIELTIEKWCAWAPGVETESDWLQWAQNKCEIQSEGSPDVKFVPAMLRRRLSLLSRMALYVANGCLEDAQPMRTIFCSQHGELHRTVSLLQSMVNDELVSPMAFSLSVPNTASGLDSISRKDTTASTALSAGADTFEHALTEAAALIANGNEKQVLLICSEQILPDIFSEFSRSHECNYAVALLLGQPNKGIKLKLSFEANNNPVLVKEPRALALLGYLLRNDKTHRVNSTRLTWSYLRYVN